MRNLREILRSKVTVQSIATAISILGLVWLFASFVNINAHNMTDHKFAKWNAFSLLVDLSERNQETTKARAAKVDTAAQAKAMEKVIVPTQQPVVTEKPTSKQVRKCAKKKKPAGKKVNSRDIYRLAQLMYAENGSSQDDNVIILTGIVVMKRVKSKCYNNTISSVISERGQYDTYIDGGVNCKPDERCLEFAEEILRFDLADDYPDSLVFQAEFKQGMEVYYKKGYEYFCTAKRLATKQRKERNKRYGNKWDS